MTLGVGLSIGTVNSVLALTTDDAEPRLRSCRTAAEIGDGADGPRAERFPSAALVGAFTDQGGVPGIANRTDPGAAAELVAAMTRRLLSETETDAAMLACPAVCSVVESAALRTALDAAGLPRVELTSEPVAAATWLQSRSPEGDADLVLVYDLGGSSLDIAVVRRDPDTDRYRLVGRAARTHEFSGRAFTAAVARYAHDTTADAGCPGHMQAVPNDDVVRLRSAWIHARCRWCANAFGSPGSPSRSSTAFSWWAARSGPPKWPGYSPTRSACQWSPHLIPRRASRSVRRCWRRGPATGHGRGGSLPSPESWEADCAVRGSGVSGGHGRDVRPARGAFDWATVGLAAISAGGTVRSARARHPIARRDGLVGRDATALAAHRATGDDRSRLACPLQCGRAGFHASSTGCSAHGVHRNR